MKIVLPFFHQFTLVNVCVQVTTPLLFKLIPAVINLGVLMHWFPSESATPIEVSLSLSLSLSLYIYIYIFSKLILEGKAISLILKSFFTKFLNFGLANYPWIPMDTNFKAFSSDLSADHVCWKHDENFLLLQEKASIIDVHNRSLWPSRYYSPGHIRSAT